MRFVHHEGPRHSPDWYDQSTEDVPLRTGDRMYIPCEGGPSWSRLESFPPRLEVTERGGLYVLQDDGPISEWRYVFVADEVNRGRDRDVPLRP